MKFSTAFLSIACIASSVAASCDKFRLRAGYCKHGELNGQYLNRYNGIAVLDRSYTNLAAFFPNPSDTDGSELYAYETKTGTVIGKFCLHPLAINNPEKVLLFEIYDPEGENCTEWKIVNGVECSTLTYDGDGARFIAVPSSRVGGYHWEVHRISKTIPDPTGTFTIDLIRECV